LLPDLNASFKNPLESLRIFRHDETTRIGSCSVPIPRKFFVRLLLLAVVGNFVLPAHVQAVEKTSLTVTIAGLKDPGGQVCLSLFAGQRGFPGDRKFATQRECVPVGETPVTYTFANLAAGSYAVAAIHDTNGNGTLDRNGLGMPTEGYGFSQNPVARMRAPAFGEAAILVIGSGTNIQIQMQYLNR
jgi:uncharacterized protein (DUF2141 family)